jgi:RNA polymerase sigma-70 factor (ECF subfamily)
MPVNLPRGDGVWSFTRAGREPIAELEYTLDDRTHAIAAPAPVTDRDLVLRMQADDLDAFEVFFARHRGLIQRTAFALTGDASAAEEVLQDTFVRAYRHRASLRTDISPVPWLYRVALNLCYSRLARRRLSEEPIGETTAELRDHAPEPPELVEREELRRAIRRGVAALPEKHQLVIVLYYLHGLSLQETAQTLGIRLGTAKSRIHYALHSLRDHLGAERPIRRSSLPLAGAPARLERDRR